MKIDFIKRGLAVQDMVVRSSKWMRLIATVPCSWRYQSKASSISLIRFSTNLLIEVLRKLTFAAILCRCSPLKFHSFQVRISILSQNTKRHKFKFRRRACMIRTIAKKMCLKKLGNKNKTTKIIRKYLMCRNLIMERLNCRSLTKKRYLN